MFTKKDIEVLKRANIEAYRAVKKRMDFIISQSDEENFDKDPLYIAYEKELGEHLEMKLKLDRATDLLK